MQRRTEEPFYKLLGPVNDGERQENYLIRPAAKNRNDQKQGLFLKANKIKAKADVCVSLVDTCSKRKNRMMLFKFNILLIFLGSELCV